MIRIIGYLILTLMFVSVSSKCDEQNSNKQVEVILTKLLETFESENHQEFIKNNFSEEFINMFPMEEHLSFFRQVKMMHGGFTVAEVKSISDFHIVVVVKSNNREAWRRIELTVDINEPHKITGFEISMSQPPSNVPYTGPVYDKVSVINPDPNAIVMGDIASEIDKHLSLLEERGFSGGVIVSKDGQVVIRKGYGYANREKKIPFTTKTAFDIGSITKQFTGAGIMKLEMMGKLSTNDKITKYFKNVPNDKKDITIHHLLTHSAGLPDALGFDYAVTPRDKIISEAFKTELSSVPGEKYRYSNVGYSLLAAVIEIVTDGSYEEFLFEYLFKPADMNSTGYKLPKWKKDIVAHGYRGTDQFGQPNQQEWDKDGPWWHLRGNGGILSTLDDMYKWHNALLGDEILSRKAKEKYHAPHIEEGLNSGTYYGYGWVVAKSLRGTKVYMHNGGNPYFSNDCYRYIDDDVFVYITSNNGAMSAIEQSDTILRMIFK